MAILMFPYTNLHELNLDWIIEKLNTEGAVLSVNGKNGIVTLTGEDIKRAAASSETVAQALTTQGTSIQNVRTQIGITELPTIAQTITGAIAENAGEIANIQDDVIGSTPLPTAAQTLTGAISEISGHLAKFYRDTTNTDSFTINLGQIDTTLYRLAILFQYESGHPSMNFISLGSGASPAVTVQKVFGDESSNSPSSVTVANNIMVINFASTAYGGISLLWLE